VPHHVIWSW